MRELDIELTFNLRPLEASHLEQVLTQLELVTGVSQLDQQDHTQLARTEDQETEVSQLSPPPTAKSSPSALLP